MKSVQRGAVLVLLATFTILFAAQCPDSVPDFKVMYQGAQVPAGVNLSQYCVDNKAWSVGSSAIGCSNSFFTPGNEVVEFLTATEAQVRGWVEDFYNNREFLNASNMLLLLNCEEPIHVREWSDYNNNPAFQEQLFEAMKLRVDIFREYFPNAIIALGPSIRGHAEGNYIQLMLDRQEALERAGEYGVFDSCDCFEPRVFLSHGTHDGPSYLAWNLAMTAQAMDIASDLRNSFGLPLPLCVTSSFVIINSGSLDNGLVDADIAKLQLVLMLMYPNVLTISWWDGSYDAAEQLPFLDELDACRYVN